MSDKPQQSKNGDEFKLASLAKKAMLIDCWRQKICTKQKATLSSLFHFCPSRLSAAAAASAAKSQIRPRSHVTDFCRVEQKNFCSDSFFAKCYKNKI